MIVSITVFVEKRVVEINSVDVRVLVSVAGAVIVIMANWVLVLVSVSVSVFVTNCVVVSVMVPRPGGLPGTSGVPVGGTKILVEVISLSVVLVLLGVRSGRVIVTVLVPGSDLGSVTVDSRVVVFNTNGQSTVTKMFLRICIPSFLSS